MSEFSFDPISHVYTLSGRVLPSVTGLIREAGLVYYPPGGDDLRKLGRYVHETIDLYDKGELDEGILDPILAPYLSQWKAFKQGTGFAVIHSEIPYYQEAFGFAGTVDKIGTLNDAIVLLDLKTGSPAKWHIIQLAAYLRLAKDWGLKGLTKAFNLYIDPKGCSLRAVSYADLCRGWDVFQACLTIHQFKGGSNGSGN